MKNQHNNLDPKALAMLYRDWVNNFLTVEKFAEYYNCTVKRANELISMGKMLHVAGY